MNPQPEDGWVGCLLVLAIVIVSTFPKQATIEQIQKKEEATIAEDLRTARRKKFDRIMRGWQARESNQPLSPSSSGSVDLPLTVDTQLPVAKCPGDYPRATICELRSPRRPSLGTPRKVADLFSPRRHTLSTFHKVTSALRTPLRKTWLSETWAASLFVGSAKCQSPMAQSPMRGSPR